MNLRVRRYNTFAPIAAACSGLARTDWRGIAAFGLPFTLYLLTLAPTVYNLDSAELTTAAASGGLVRATGYPLYLLLGRIWSMLPIGDVGYRMNLFSAFNGALTIALADRILRRWHVGPYATFGALGLLASAPFFWAMSLIAEVYTLHTALMAGLILLLLRWAAAPSSRRLAWVGLMAGLSLGHHAATVLLIPGCVWYVFTVAPRRVLSPRSLFLVLAATLLGLSVYLYLPLRFAAQPAFNYAGQYDSAGTFIPVDLRAPQGLWWLVSGRAFGSQMLAYQGAELLNEIGRFATHLWQAFLAIGIGPGLVGAAVLLRRDRRLGGMLLLMFVCNAGFYIDYRVVDKDTMFLPAYLIWALWLGVGYQWLITEPRRGMRTLARRRSKWLLRSILISAVVFAVVWNWRLVNLSGDWSARTRGEAILDEVKPNALIFGWWDSVPIIEYLQLVEGRRPDVQAINRFLITPEAMLQLIQREMPKRSVYVDTVSDDLREFTNVTSAGPIYEVRPRP